jgi:eukaryotic-like serine/threonine-protein kinase
MTVPKLIGRYEIVAELGRGAMGSVFKARDPAVGRIVALKTVHAAALAGEYSSEYRTRFYREARASGVLAHPGIVPVFDVGEHEDAPFLVMEFVDGRTLDDAVKKGQRFPLDRVCEIGEQIADALAYAHRQGVIHRDIKPANILMTSREVYGSERPRITDFGIAKLASSDITTSGQLLGTPSFMPPEQFTGQPVDGRADLYSLGVILYFLATGEQPFPGETMTAVSYKVVHTDPIPPSKLNPAVSPRLERTILKCLAKNPADRFQTCEELAEVLASIRAGAPNTASEPAAPALDADATLGPAQVSHPPAPDATGAPAPATATIPPASKQTAAPSSAKPKKPVQVETLFAAILLGIAGLGIVAAGAWFMFDRLLDLAHRQHQQATTPPAAQTPPPQPVVQVPQPEPTPAATDQVQQGFASSEAANAASPSTPTTAPGAPGTTAPAGKTSPAPAAAPPVPAKSGPASGSSKKSAAAKSRQPSPPPAQTPPAPAANTTVASTAPASTSSAPAGPTGTAASASSASPSPATSPFDPRKLDPNTSTKIKIDVTKLPNGLPVNVKMDKQPYLSFITGDKTDLDNLYVPAGVQEFHVSIKSGGQEFASKGISEEFKAKKKKTLRIELTENGNSLSNATVPLPKDAQVYVSFPFVLTDLF